MYMYKKADVLIKSPKYDKNNVDFFLIAKLNRQINSYKAF